MPDKYFEKLPEDCPDADAQPVNNIKFYRLVSAKPALDEDFYSERKVWPHRKFNVSECQACSLSIYNDLSAATELTMLPKFKSKLIAEITLTLTNGPVKQTFKNIHHHSWWRENSFELKNNINYLQ